MSQTITDADAATDEPIGKDGKPFDPARAQRLIETLRRNEHENMQKIRALQNGLRAVARGLPVDPLLLGDDPDTEQEIQAMRATIIDIGASFGLGPDVISGTNGKVALEQAVRSAVLAAPLARATAKAQVDHDLTAAVLAQSGRLAKVDLKGDVMAQVSEAVASVRVDHPGIQLQSAPAASGVPFPAGSSRLLGTTMLSRADLAGMAPAEIVKARAEGRIAGVGTG